MRYGGWARPLSASRLSLSLSPKGVVVVDDDDDDDDDGGGGDDYFLL